MLHIMNKVFHLILGKLKRLSILISLLIFDVVEWSISRTQWNTVCLGIHCKPEYLLSVLVSNVCLDIQWLPRYPLDTWVPTVCLGIYCMPGYLYCMPGYLLYAWVSNVCMGIYYMSYQLLYTSYPLYVWISIVLKDTQNI